MDGTHLMVLLTCPIITFIIICLHSVNLLANIRRKVET